MKRIALSLALVGLLCQLLHAQSGHYFLSHYKPGMDKISYLSFDIHQDKNGILYFANRSGLLQFDGRTWTQVPANGAVYTLTAGPQGDLYAGGYAGFGKVGHNERNQLTYSSLSDSLPGVKNVIASTTLQNTIYFVSEKSLYKVIDSTAVASLVTSAGRSEGSYVGLYTVGDQVFVDTELEGVKKLIGGKLEPAEYFKGKHFVFSEQAPDQKTTLVATEDNKFYIQREGASPVQFFPADFQYLLANVVVNCAWVNDRLVALGTLRGGVVFVDMETRETAEIVNYFTGLPDNEIFSLHTDHHQGVWIAHEYGFSRAAPFLPFRTFNHYPGVSGNLLCVQSFDEDVYVGTSVGLFRLSKDEIFANELYEVTQTIPVSSEPAGEVIAERKKSRRGFLGLGKKKTAAPPPVVARPPAAKQHRQVQKVRRILTGIEHSFKQVSGVDGKVDQLIIVGKKLIGGGISGAFEVNGSKATPLTNLPARSVFYSKNLNQVLVSTYYGGILAFKDSKKGWTSTPFPDSLSIYSDYMFEDHLQNLWICARDRVFRIEIEAGEILDAETISLPSTSMDRTVGLAYGKEIYITQNGEFFRYLSFKNTFIKYDSLPGPKKYFASSGSFWFYDGHRWRTIDRKVQGEIKTEWLALFPDIRFLAPADVGKSLWVITASNELYKFSSDLKKLPTQQNPLFLKEVRNQQAKLSPKSLLVDERESALTFEFIQPDYVSLQAVEYHYWIKGLQNTWSEWSTMNNVVSFPFIPPGRYSVHVESRDLFGNVTTLETIELSVVPPYWKRPIFYALEFLFFGALVVLSLRLKASSIRYRYVSQFLTALTVVLLIQFIQTIAYANIKFESSPVTDFFIQVMIALVVLPAENFLRKRIVKASEQGKH
ncbi:MAG: hypothetical protein SH819_05760 [Cytophagales bacterium]|nr:hypothetical protein [Cytophagales bacterium]